MKKYKKLVVLTALTAALSTSALAAGTGITDIRNIWAKMPFSIFMTIIMSALPTVSSVPTTILPVKKQLLSSTI